MDQRIYHGNITPGDLAQALMARFNRGNLRVQQIGEGDKIAVQIASSNVASAGGQTALSVSMEKVEDGVSISVGQQAWLGVAASIGFTALAALRNPFSLLGRLDDLAQDIESIQLTEEVWAAIDQHARSIGTGHELSDRLKRIVCEFCRTANPVGESSCIACGAPLGDVQPETCKNCGFVLKLQERFCPNCGQPVTR